VQKSISCACAVCGSNTEQDGVSVWEFGEIENGYRPYFREVRLKCRKCEHRFSLHQFNRRRINAEKGVG
jgi:hypothetical protein